MSRYDHPAWESYVRKVLLELDPDLHDDEEEEQEQ